MTREQHLAAATAAVTRAAKVADIAEHLARGTRHDEGAHLAATGALWNGIALTHAAIAAALFPQDELTLEQADA